MNPDPRLVTSAALAKTQALETRVNALAGGPPVAPSLVYAAGTTVVTQNVAGTYTWTCPAGVTSAKIECWGAGAGGGGGDNTAGGEGGGGGEYACEPNYPLVPGQVYGYTVGPGGTGGTTFSGGLNGTSSLFDNSGVFANGGTAGWQYNGGPGGTGSSNTITHPGGAGAGTGSPGTGGCGGGGSAGSLGSGSPGAVAGGSTGAGGGAGGSGTSGGGGPGGNAGVSGSAGLVPGGGGGGAGSAAGGGQFSKDYQFTTAGTYFGSDASGGHANVFKDYGTLWQGGTTASGGSYNGTMRALGILPSSVAADLAGATIDKVQLRLLNLSSWYNSGMYVILGYGPNTYLPGSYAGVGATGVKTYWVDNSQQNVQDLTATGLGAALKSGAARALVLGPGTPGFWAWNYGSFYGAGGDPGMCPDLHVEYHTGATPVQAGAGHDGQVRITYTVSGAAGTLTAALQPAVGTDPAGNAFTAGYTGPVTAYQPGASPTLAETWHSIPYVSGGPPTTGYVRCKVLSELNLVILDILISAAANGAGLTYQYGPLPSSAYYATQFGGMSSGFRTYPIGSNTSLTASGQLPRVIVPSSGNIQILIPPSSGATSMAATIIYPVD